MHTCVSAPDCLWGDGRWGGIRCLVLSPWERMPSTGYEGIWPITGRCFDESGWFSTHYHFLIQLLILFFIPLNLHPRCFWNQRAFFNNFPLNGWGSRLQGIPCSTWLEKVSGDLIYYVSYIFCLMFFWVCILAFCLHAWVCLLLLKFRKECQIP